MLANLGPFSDFSPSRTILNDENELYYLSRPVIAMSLGLRLAAPPQSPGLLAGLISSAGSYDDSFLCTRSPSVCQMYRNSSIETVRGEGFGTDEASLSHCSMKHQNTTSHGDSAYLPEVSINLGDRYVCVHLGDITVSTACFNRDLRSDKVILSLRSHLW